MKRFNEEFSMNSADKDDNLLDWDEQRILMYISTLNKENSFEYEKIKFACRVLETVLNDKNYSSN